MNTYPVYLRALLLIALLSASTAYPATPNNTNLPTIELSADATRSAANDLVRATVAAEASGATLGDVSKQVNTQINEALKTAKSYSSVKTQSSNTSTYPNYSKSGKIESWRMRSELSLESGDTIALSELLGKLQTALSVTSLLPLPSSQTRKNAENEAILDAISAFKARAKVIADALGKSFRIKQLAVNTNGSVTQPRYRAATKSMLSESAPMPVETGDSLITATVSGQIELE